VLEKLEKYYEDGLLIKQTHPTKDLTIWNYSQKVQYEKLWDDVTMQCRGLVTNSKGQIVARPFKKFFNLEEMDSPPSGEFKVYEKMDGSLGILFYYEEELTDEKRYNIWFNNNYETGMERFFDSNNLPDYDNPYYEPTPKTKGDWVFASRGSFTSEQAIKGAEILKKYNIDSLHPGYTYLFEIIYPENRIVVNYGPEEKLILLGIVHTMIDDFEMPLEHSDGLIRGCGFELVKSYNLGDDIESLKNNISNDNEGYVLRFNTKPISRIKIKGEEYVRLHRIITNISNKDIWEYLKDNKPFDELLEKVPDEFNEWVKTTVRDLRYGCFQLRERAGKLHDGFRYGKFNDKDPEPSKKEFAEFAMKQEEILRPILFSMWDKNYSKVDEIIWKSVKPKYSKPFKNEQ
jgi:RNA ligase